MRDIPVTYGFRLVWDRSSEYSQGAGAWYRQYGFFKRGNKTWGDPTGANNKQVVSCSRYAQTTASDPLGLSSFTYYIQYDRSRAWDVYVVDKSYPQIKASNYVIPSGGLNNSPGKAIFTETTPGGYQRQVRTGVLENCCHGNGWLWKQDGLITRVYGNGWLWNQDAPITLCMRGNCRHDV